MKSFTFFLGDTNARILLCPPVGAEFVRTAAADRKIPVFSVEMNEQGHVRIVGAPTGVTATEPTADDIALVLHTSGSTGRPKRVPLRHFNLAVSSANIANTYALTEEDVSLCIMPLFHIHGLIGSTMATLLSGGTVVVPTKFNALSFWRTVRENRVTWYSGRAHDAPASAGAGASQAGGGRLAALHPFLQRALVGGTDSQDRGLIWRAFCRSLRHDRSRSPDDFESSASTTSQGGFGGSGRRLAHQHHGQGRQSSRHRISAARSLFRVQMYFVDTKTIRKQTPAPS